MREICVVRYQQGHMTDSIDPMDDRFWEHGDYPISFIQDLGYGFTFINGEWKMLRHTYLVNYFNDEL